MTVASRMLSPAGMSATDADPEARARDLQEAFRSFSALSAQLDSSYRLLEERVATLTEELARAHDDRLRELAAKESLANRLSHLLSVLPAGVVVLDGDGRIREANPAAHDLLGGSLVGQSWREVIAHAFAPQRAAGPEVRLLDGRSVTVETCSLKPEAGQIVLLADVTETRQLQESVARRERLTAMGEMVASLAHQIRTPLASAILYVSQLEAAPSSETATRYAPRLRASLRHLERLANDMLLFARGGAGERERLAVAELMASLQMFVEPAAEAAGIAAEFRNDAGETACRGNRDALLGALQNLAANAIQAAGRDGRIEVTARAGGEVIEFLVGDSGPGVAVELRERIFEPFFTTRAQGTGLGLAVVQAVAQAHQGTAWVEPRAAGGSTFGIRLPLWSSECRVLSAESKAQDRAPRTARITLPTDESRLRTRSES